MSPRLHDAIVPLTPDLEAEHGEAVLGLLASVFGEASAVGRRTTYPWQFHGDGIGTNSRFLVYWEDGRPAGTAGLFDTTLFVDGVPHRAAFFTDLATAPVCRGRGVGARLTRAARDAGQEVTIGLGTNPASNHIMRKEGFVEVRGVRPMFRLLRLEPHVRKRLASVRLGLPRRLLTAMAPSFLEAAFWPLRWLDQTRQPGEGQAGSGLPALGRWPGRVPNLGGGRSPVRVEPVGAYPPELDRFMEAVPHFWPITLAPDHAAWNRRFRDHPTHHYHLEMAWRGTEPVGAAAWRVFSESPGLVMGHLSSLYYLPGEEDVADALIASGLRWLHERGAYLVKALASHPRVASRLRRHRFFARGESPGLLFHTARSDLAARLLRDPWLVHLSTSDLDVR